MNDTPLPRPRMKKAENIYEIKTQTTTNGKWEINTYENRNISYQVLWFFLPKQNS